MAFFVIAVTARSDHRVPFCHFWRPTVLAALSCWKIYRGGAACANGWLVETTLPLLSYLILLRRQHMELTMLRHARTCKFFLALTSSLDPTLAYAGRLELDHGVGDWHAFIKVPGGPRNKQILIWKSGSRCLKITASRGIAIKVLSALPWPVSLHCLLNQFSCIIIKWLLGIRRRSLVTNIGPLKRLHRSTYLLLINLTIVIFGLRTVSYPLSVVHYNLLK